MAGRPCRTLMVASGCLVASGEYLLAGEPVPNVAGAIDLKAVAHWVGRHARPILVDAEVIEHGGSWWQRDAFRGH